MHTIRLRGPWKAELPKGVRVFNWEKEIAAILAESLGEQITLSRNFNLPSGLRPQDQVNLSCAGLAVCGMRINGSELSCSEDFHFAVTEHLQPSNHLEMAVCGTSIETSTDPLITLEIISASPEARK